MRIRRHLPAVFVLLLPLAFAPTRSTAADPSTRPTLTVAAYNINWGIEHPQHLKSVEQAILATKADIIAIQEGNPTVFAHLARQLANDYPHRQFYPARYGAGFGWLSKHQLLNKRIIPRKFGLFDCVIAEVTLDNRTITLANVHLQPFDDPDQNSTVVGMLRVMARTEATRHQEIELIHSRLPKDAPIIILGDFNCLHLQAAPAFLAEKGFTESFAAVTRDAADPKHFSWYWDTGRKVWQYRIDYIWHTPHFKTTACQILRAGPSDHYPIVAHLEFPPPTP